MIGTLLAQVSSDSAASDHYVLTFALVMVVILIAPLVAGRLKLPGIVALILLGAVMGPSALGLLDLEREPAINLLGRVGLLYLMFVAGLGIDLNKFDELRNRSLVFGLISFFLPQIAGILAGLYLLDYSIASSLLLGSIVGTHTLLAYPIVKRLRITRNTAVSTTMGATMVCDVLALTALAIVAASRGEGLGLVFWLKFIGLVTLYMAGVVLILPRLGHWFFRSVRDQAEVQFVFLLAILFTASYIAHLVYLAPIIGAFLVGLTMNRLIPENSTLMSRVNFVGDALLIPFFLVSVGLLVDFRVLLSSFEIWYTTLIFTLLVVLGKGSAAKLAQHLFKQTPAEGWVNVGLTIPQAAGTLAVTLVGYSLGLLDETAVNAVVLLILVSSMIGSAIVSHYGREVAAAEEAMPQQASDAPQRLLVPLSNPRTGPWLMELALLLHKKDAHEPIYPLTIARDGENVNQLVAESEKMLSQAVIYGAAAAVPITPMTRVDMNVVNGILRAVKELRISNVVIGWDGKAPGQHRIFGTILDQLLLQCPQMITVCKLGHPLNTCERVVVAIPPFAEREPGFLEAIRSIKTLAHQLGATLVLTATEDAMPRLRKWVEQARPTVRMATLAVPRWEDLMGKLVTELTQNDLFILLSAREGRLAWQPNLNRLPEWVAARFTDINLLTMYPSEVVVDPGPGNGAASPAGDANQPLHPDRITLDLDESSYEKAVEQIIRLGFHQQPETIETIHRSVIGAVNEYSNEITPGVAMLHAHLAQVPETMLLLGVSRKGVTFPRIAKPVHVIFVLLSPLSQSPEKHLNNLAQIAMMASAPGMAEQLRDLETLDEVTEALTRRLPAEKTTPASG